MGATVRQHGNSYDEAYVELARRHGYRFPSAR